MPAGPSFNEARAFCAGNHMGQWRADQQGSGFNEARAFCAGNLTVTYNGLQENRSFNEARAFCAGNPGDVPAREAHDALLQ